MRKFVATAVVACLAVGVAFAADVIKLELKDFKFEGSSELLGYNEGDSKLFFYVAGKTFQTVKIPEDGEYTITIEASCDEAKGEKAKLSLKVGDVEVEKSFELKAAEMKEYTFKAKLKKGDPKKADQKLEIAFLNDTYKENEYDLNMYIHSVKIEKKK